MRAKIVLLMIIGIMARGIAQEQPCLPNNITSNPNNPVNNIHPFYVNYFDWTQGEYDVSWGNIGQMTNPNWVTNGDAKDLFDLNDYLPDDGWELVYVDLGLDRFGNPLPQGIASGQMWFILYNKYRAILRVFVAIDQLDPNNLIEVELSIPSGSYNTAIFASTDKVKKPLRSFNPHIETSVIKKFTNGTQFSKHWHYADFAVNYDPCTCQPLLNNISAESRISINVSLLKTALIELEGTSSGTVKMAEKTSSKANGQAYWDEFYGVVKKGSSAVEAGNKAYKSFGLFKSDVGNTAQGSSAEIEMKSGLDNLGKFLTSKIPALKYVPYASEALALIDFFVGGGKKNETIKIPPLAMQLEHSFRGEITFDFDYVNTDFFMPGSQFSPAVNPVTPHGDPRYPIYNEVLGVYTLLDKPIIEMYFGTVTNLFVPPGPVMIDQRRTRKIFKIDKNSLHLVINPAANLTLVESYCQLNIIDKNRGDLISSSGGSIINDTIWVSDLFPLGCIEDNAIILDEEFFTPQRAEVYNEIDDVHLAVVLVFENLQGDRFLHKGSWQVDVIKQPYPYEPDVYIQGPDYYLEYDWFKKPLFMGTEIGFLNAPVAAQYIGQTITSSNRVQETIFIENSTTGPSVGEILLTAGEEITVKPGSSLKPNSRLAIYRPGLDCETAFDLADDTYISSLCSSQEYQNIKGAAKKEYEEDNPSLTRYEIMTYPNPANNVVNILLPTTMPIENKLEIMVLDLTGRQVFGEVRTVNPTGRYLLNLPELATGVYLLQVRTGNRKAVEKVMIK